MKRHYLYGADGRPTHRLLVHRGQLVALRLSRSQPVRVRNKRAEYAARQRRVARRVAQRAAKREGES